jgi:hypothetical protein
MSKKLDRALNGPSWTEVILGAFISVALGIALAAAYLIFKPVTQVVELPKEPVPGMVYYIEGSHDGAKARRAVVKAKALTQGGSLTMSEDELNILLIPVDQPSSSGKKPGATETTELFSPGTPNIRIAEGVVQVSTPVRVRYGLVGLDTTFLVQTRGTIVRDGDSFVYQPDTIYLGSCPVQRLPMVPAYVMKKLAAAEHVPTELATIWHRASDITVEEKLVKVTTPRP